MPWVLVPSLKATLLPQAIRSPLSLRSASAPQPPGGAKGIVAPSKSGCTVVTVRSRGAGVGPAVGRKKKSLEACAWIHRPRQRWEDQLSRPAGFRRSGRWALVTPRSRVELFETLGRQAPLH